MPSHSPENFESETETRDLFDEARDKRVNAVTAKISGILPLGYGIYRGIETISTNMADQDFLTIDSVSAAAFVVAGVTAFSLSRDSNNRANILEAEGLARQRESQPTLPTD